MLVSSAVQNIKLGNEQKIVNKFSKGHELVRIPNLQTEVGFFFC